MSDAVEAGQGDAEGALTIAEAARAARTDRRSIRRLLEAGALPGAFKDDQGFWRIFVSELEEAGLPLGDRSPENPTATSPVSASGSDPAQLILELARMEARAEKAEALLAAETRHNEELRAALDAERRTLAAVLGAEQPPEPEPRPQPARLNWQRELRAARSREQQQRAARAREGQR